MKYFCFEKCMQDFEKYGVFDAQQALEKMHRKEEDELYRQILEERQRKVRALEKAIKTEKEAVVKELIAFFEKKGSSAKERERGYRKVTAFPVDRLLLKGSQLISIEYQGNCYIIVKKDYVISIQKFE